MEERASRVGLHLRYYTGQVPGLSIRPEKLNGKEQERSLPARQSGPNVPAFKEGPESKCPKPRGQMAVELEDNQVATKLPLSAT